MSLVLDAGALIAVDGGERAMFVRLKAAASRGEVPWTHGGVVGQVWRDGARQAGLARVLRGIEVRPLNDHLGRAAGELLARASSTDVIDAALVLLSQDGDDIVTSDARDLRRLALAAGRHVEMLPP